jgi:hypothetical protein
MTSPLDAATSTAPAVTNVASHFMLDGGTYGRGAELGFSGVDFSVVGRGGALGDVDADVIAASFAFFEPGLIRTLWDQGRAALPAAEATREFAACGHSWGEDNIPDQVHADRLATLAAKLVASARPACAPLFAAWRALPVPDAPKAQALHQMQLLRELRGGLHAAAIITHGLSPHEAVSVRSPAMAPLFGWNEPVADPEAFRAIWEQAEAATNRAMAHAYAGLEDRERDELVELMVAVDAATSGGQAP